MILINCAPPKKIRTTECAQGLVLSPKKHTVHVGDCDGNYLGMLPDDLGKRLNLLIKGGNTYQCFVKSIGVNDLSVFIRELTRVKKYRDIPSFPAKIVSDHLIDNADQILKDEEDKQRMQGHAWHTCRRRRGREAVHEGRRDVLPEARKGQALSDNFRPCQERSRPPVRGLRQRKEKEAGAEERATRSKGRLIRRQKDRQEEGLIDIHIN